MAHNVTPEGVFRKTQKAPKNGSSSCATCHRNCPVKVEKGDTSESVQDVELDCWWLNLPSSVGECVPLYCGHGTSEQFHSELKSDIGIEQLPSGRMAPIAFNCLRLIGDAALPAPASEREPKRLRL